MKASSISGAILLTLLLTSCIKDSFRRTYTIRTAAYSLKQEVRDAAKPGAPQPIVNQGPFAFSGTTMFISEWDTGIHILDCSNPDAPLKKGFIPVPGNRTVAVRNNVLYADCYCDLFIFRITSTDDIGFAGFVTGVFASQMDWRYDERYVEREWRKRDTTITGPNIELKNVQDNNSLLGPNPNSSYWPLGVFAVVNDHLYAADSYDLTAYALADPISPVRKGSHWMYNLAEEILPYNRYLLVRSSGAPFVYSIGEPDLPMLKGSTFRLFPCFPVIGDGNFAYHPLHNGSTCGTPGNQLDVLDITHPLKPILLHSYPLDNPKEIAKDGKVLFICDAPSGLKVFDATDPYNLVLKNTVAVGNASDVIALNGFAYVTLPDGIRICSYDAQFNVQQRGIIMKN